MTAGDALVPAAGAQPTAAAAPQATDPFAIVVQATQLAQAGQFGAAAQVYAQAAETFDAWAAHDASDAVAPCLAEYCRAMAEGTWGSDLARNGNRAKALEFQTGAINRFVNAVIPLAGHVPGSLRSGILVDFTYLKAGKSSMEMMQDIIAEDVDSARRTARRILADFADSRAQIDAMPPGADIGTLHATVNAVERAVRGLDAYAAAEKASAERQWDAAMDAFADAKQGLRDARDAYAVLPTLAAQAQVWQLLVETLIEPARKRCSRLQGMCDELDRFKDGMAALAHAVGSPQVNATTTTIVDVKSRVDVQVTLINSFEDRTRQALGDLRAAVAAAPADAAARAEALAAIDKVLAPEPHDGGFFDRFKRFCSDSAEVIGDIAKVAGPVAIAWNVAAPFFGLPVLPLPAGK